MSPRGHASWCTEQNLCGDGDECYHHDEELDLDATFEAARRVALGGESLSPRVILALSRNLDGALRHGAVPDTDSCVLMLGVEDDEKRAELDLTIAEARELARRLNELCDKADVDARVVASIGS